MSPTRRVSAINVAGAIICALAAVALCGLSAQSGWDVTSTYGGGSGVAQVLVLSALVVSLVVAVLILLALRYLHVAVRRRAVVVALVALVTLFGILAPAAFGAAAHARGVRAETLACRPDVVRDVLALARAAGRVVPTNGSESLGRTDGRCVAVVAVPGETAAAVKTLDGAARGLGWASLSARTWRSPAGVVVAATESVPHADSVGETVVDLGGRGQ
jgi:hypothetical protein